MVSTSAQLAQAARRAHPLRFLPWAVALLAMIVAIGTFIAGRRGNSTSSAEDGSPAGSAPLRKTELRIPLPTRKTARPRLTGLAISPDGRKLAYANADGLWVQRLDQLLPPSLISAGEKVTTPFWSPRSTDVAWFDDGSLKRAPVTGGRVMTICRVTSESSWRGAEGGAWLGNDDIIFATGSAGLDRVPAQGGNAQVALAPAEGDLDFHEVSALPDGRGVVFVVHRKEDDLTPMDTIAVWNPKELKKPKKVLFQRSGSRLANPVFSSSGHLVFTDSNSEPDENHWAVPISLRTWQPTGEPFRLGEGGDLPSVSADGTLALVHGQATFALLEPRQLVWVDRSGRSGLPFGPVQKGLILPRLSPDDRFVAFSAGENNRASRTWILDIAGGSALPLRPEGEFERNPYWLPGGREIAVTAGRTNISTSIIRAVEGSRPSEAIGQGVLLHLSPSGQYAFLRHGLRTALNVTNFYVRLSGDRSQRIQLPGGSPNLVDVSPLQLSLSPDDAMLAFQWDANDRSEIWAVAFPGFTNRVLVSRGGGIDPQWSRDGKELFYLSEDGAALMAVPVVNQNGRSFGEPVKLFDLPASVFGGKVARLTSLFDASADGQRFLMMHNVKESNAPDLQSEPKVLLIQNWFEEFREKK